ncbi:MAG: T9SS type A sorting domain-containing protein [Ignavibacteriae bacterium]|nr:T9SS type A sorting domain-containing protein [Ignavibacteriota bacterium]
MKKYIYIFLFVLLLPVLSNAQYYTADFEGLDSNSLPAGWYKTLNPPVANPPYPYANWTIRDSGLCMPNISCSPIRHSRCYQGLKAVNVTWGTSIINDTLANDNCDAWLITKKFNNIPGDGYFTFYACGGSPSWCDSLQVWVSTTDSTIASFTNYLGTIIWPAGSVYGAFSMNFYDLSSFAGQNIRIAFRYVSSNSDGYVVMLDYFQMFGTVGINQIGTNVPSKFALQQNYPNPFNPTTKIKFDIAKSTQVKLEVFNNLGQLVQTLFNEYKPAGYYEADFTAKNIPSGIYYYRLTTDYFTDIKKMVVVK